MTQNQSTSIEQDLRQIANILLLNGTLTDCPGLVYGKTGIAIFFFHYAQHAGNDLFEKYAFDLIEAIQEQIHVNSPADYERGIAGIGVGLDYLIQNNFLEADDDIFEDFDKRMYRAVMYDPCQDFSLYDGLTGYGRYWISRLHQLSSKQAQACLLRIARLIEEKLPDISVKEQTEVYCFLHDLCQIQGFEMCAKFLEKLEIPSTDFPRLDNSTVVNIVRICQHNRYFNSNLQDEINAALQQIPDLDMEKSPASIGFLTGYAGEGMLRLTALQQTNISWMYLL